MAELSRSARKVAAALAERGIDTTVQELSDSARDAAAALGCEIAQITKSLVFREVAPDRPVLVLTSGPDRVDEFKLTELLGGAVEQAQAAWVKQHTGFTVGGGTTTRAHRTAHDVHRRAPAAARHGVGRCGNAPRGVSRSVARARRSIEGQDRLSNPMKAPFGAGSQSPR